MSRFEFHLDLGKSDYDPYDVRPVTSVALEKTERIKLSPLVSTPIGGRLDSGSRTPREQPTVY